MTPPRSITGSRVRGVEDAAPYKQFCNCNNSQKFVVFANSIGGVKTPPYSTILQRDFGPGGVNVEDGSKALRKMQHSCIFWLLAWPTTALGFLGASGP